MNTTSVGDIELITGSPSVVAAAFECSYPAEIDVQSGSYKVSTNPNLMTPTNAVSDATSGTGDLR